MCFIRVLTLTYETYYFHIIHTQSYDYFKNGIKPVIRIKIFIFIFPAILDEKSRILGRQFRATLQ